ncbi:MAG: hypothetical protein ACM3S4_04880 [Burkholderiales bacterium]
MGANERWKELKQEIASSENAVIPADPFNWPKYLKGLGITVLVIGFIIAWVLVFTIVVVEVPGTYSQVEFSLSGFIITISTLVVSLIIHAMLNWLAEMLRIANSIRSKLK